MSFVIKLQSYTFHFITITSQNKKPCYFEGYSIQLTKNKFNSTNDIRFQTKTDI